MALLSGFLADSPPSLSRLYPSLLLLAALRARVCWRGELVSLPSQPPFAVSIRKNVEELLSFNSSGISWKVSSERLWRFTSMVCICAKDPQWSSSPFGSERDFCLQLEHLRPGLEHSVQGRLLPCPRGETSALFWVLVARSKNPSGLPSPNITKLKQKFWNKTLELLSYRVTPSKWKIIY